MSASAVWGQANPHITSLQARITQDLVSIRAAEQQHLSKTQQGTLWAQLALEYQGIAAFAKAEDAYNRSLDLLKTTPSARATYAATLDNLATLYMTFGRVDDAESATKQALAERKKLGNLSDLGLSQEHLADIALVRHQSKKAEQLAQRATETMQSSSSPPRAGVLSALITLTYARCARGHSREGVASAQQALVFANKTFEPDSVATGFALETLGFAEWKSGLPQDGEKDMLQALRILKTNLAEDDPRLAGALLQYRTYLIEANRQAEAKDIQQQVTTMVQQAGISCPGCAISARSLRSSGNSPGPP